MGYHTYNPTAEPDHFDAEQDEQLLLVSHDCGSYVEWNLVRQPVDPCGFIYPFDQNGRYIAGFRLRVVLRGVDGYWKRERDVAGEEG